MQILQKFKDRSFRNAFIFAVYPLVSLLLAMALIVAIAYFGNHPFNTSKLFFKWFPSFYSPSLGIPNNIRMFALGALWVLGIAYVHRNPEKLLRCATGFITVFFFSSPVMFLVFSLCTHRAAITGLWPIFWSAALATVAGFMLLFYTRLFFRMAHNRKHK